MKIAIFGCGPAGMFAAHAAVEMGHEVTIFSKKARKSFMRGAQYLHRPIPGLSGAPFRVDYILEGTVQGYREKVYGDVSDVLVSPVSLEGESDAWDIREAYDRAWSKYSHLIQSFEFGSEHWPIETWTSDMVISTIPAPLICSKSDEHEFSSQKIWSTDFVRYRGVFVSEGGKELDNRVVCSGDPQDWWYRISRIQGWENTEYPYDCKPSAENVWEVVKPISTTCDCEPDMLRLGRYGKWTKGVLSDAAYYDTQAEIMKIESTTKEEAK